MRASYKVFCDQHGTPYWHRGFVDPRNTAASSATPATCEAGVGTTPRTSNERGTSPVLTNDVGRTPLTDEEEDAEMPAADASDLPAPGSDVVDS